MPKLSEEQKRVQRKNNKADSLPGDLTGEDLIHRMIRVNQAGEFGASQIYKGQLAVLKGSNSEATIRKMAKDENNHLAIFNQLLIERGVRPTALSPLWRVAGFSLGVGSALLGEKAAMACTVAVEEVIITHYQKQNDKLRPEETKLRAAIEESCSDEVSHRQIGIDLEAKNAPGYRVLSKSIKAGTRLAIWLSERI